MFSCNKTTIENIYLYYVGNIRVKGNVFPLKELNAYDGRKGKSKMGKE